MAGALVPLTGSELDLQISLRSVSFMASSSPAGIPLKQWMIMYPMDIDSGYLGYPIHDLFHDLCLCPIISIIA